MTDVEEIDTGDTEFIDTGDTEWIGAGAGGDIPIKRNMYQLLWVAVHNNEET